MRYKICPACGEQNLPSSMECASCGYDLMGVAAVEPGGDRVQETAGADGASEPTGPDAGKGKETAEKPIAPRPVRICPNCGERNPSQARKCQNCHEDISDIMPLPEAETARRRYCLEMIGAGYIYPVPEGMMVVGRDHEMRDALGDKVYVSRTHAEITASDGRLYIENLSTTNYTYVNNEKIPDGRVELHLGDEVGLGGMVAEGKRQEQAAYFLVGVMP